MYERISLKQPQWLYPAHRKGRVELNWTVSHANTRALLLRLFTLSQIISYFRKTKEVFVLRQICFWETCVRAFNYWRLMLRWRNATKGTCADFLIVRMWKSFLHRWNWLCSQKLSGNNETFLMFMPMSGFHLFTCGCFGGNLFYVDYISSTLFQTNIQKIQMQRRPPVRLRTKVINPVVARK